MLLRLILPAWRRTWGRTLAIVLQFAVGATTAAAAVALASGQQALETRLLSGLKPVEAIWTALAPGLEAPPAAVARVRHVIGEWRPHRPGEPWAASVIYDSVPLAPWEAGYAVVSREFLRWVRPRAVAGRWLSPDDWQAPRPYPAVVNAAAARWLQVTDIGQRIGLQGDLQVVGILFDREPLPVRYNELLHRMVVDEAPLILVPDSAESALLKTDLGGALTDPEPHALWFGLIPVERRQALLARPLSSAVAASRTLTRASLLPLLTLSSIILLLAGLGCAGMLLTTLEQRQREFGIRQALGATPASLAAQFVGETLGITLAGGTVGCLLAGQLVRRLTGASPPGGSAAWIPVLTGSVLLALLVALAPVYGLWGTEPDKALRMR